MKIQSHEIAMQSKHVEYKSMISSEMNFETYFNDSEELKGLDEKPQATSLMHKDSCLCPYLRDRDRTLEGIINNLIKMLQERVLNNTAPSVEEENINGYVHMSHVQKYEEHESLSFATKGNIQTDKGSLDIDLNFSMSRSFVVENRIDIYSAFDPLIINLEGEIPDLLEDTFSFDLDNDGKSDQISMLASGNGFLALDKNEDGKVNQGSELFGTLTGNGFGELSAYDEDENSWIDESDSIFDSLQIWLKNEDANEKELVGLGEVGIGAIYLNSELSEFTYKTAANNVLGELKSSGIFLKENGEVGNVSQIDFTAQNKGKKEEPLATLLQA